MVDFRPYLIKTVGFLLTAVLSSRICDYGKSERLKVMHIVDCLSEADCSCLELQAMQAPQVSAMDACGDAALPISGGLRYPDSAAWRFIS